MIENIKRGLAIVILLCFFLPLAQCSSEGPPSAQRRPDDAPRVWIPAHGIKFQSTDEIPLAVMYVWPIAFIAVRRVARTVRATVAVGVIETVLAAGSLYLALETIRIWGSVRYGGVLLTMALAAYLVVVAVTLYRCASGAPPTSHTRQES